MVEAEGNISETIDQLLSLVRRRRWWIITIAVCTTLATIAVVLRLPDRYESEAVLVVVQQRISQRYVDPATTMSAAESVDSMTREILSRNRLLGIIDAFNLYAADRETSLPEGLVAKMRKDVIVEAIDQIPGRGDFGAFKVAFRADNPRLAQEVTGRLTSLFIEESMKLRGGQAATTTKFLTEQLEEAKQRLAQQEKKITEFKMKNLGELPEQEQANLSNLTDLRIQLQSTMSSLSRAQQQRVSLESVINGSLARLQLDRTGLLSRYTPKHPEVLKKDQEIEKAEALLARLRGDSTAVTKAQSLLPFDDPLMAQLKSQVDSNIAEIETLSRDEQQLRREISQSQGRLKLAPVREQQLAAVLRDYELSKQDYTDLSNKQLRSQLTASLEEQQEGQHFRLVDPPTLPLKPSSPKRFKISLGAAAAGAILGFAIAFFIDMRDRSYHVEKELRHHVSVPLVVGVPLLLTKAEERSEKVTRVLEWMGASVMTFAVVAAEYYVYWHG